MAQSERLDGWKRIAGHFKRHRSTVIRWKEHGLPVHQVPGSGIGSVFAYTHELDAWLAKGVSQGLDLESAAEAQPAPGAWTRIDSYIATALAVSLAPMLLVLLLIAQASPRGDFRRDVDSETARQYIKARGDWALRTPESLRSSIAEFRAILKRDPKYAPAWSGLADAYLLSSEFDGMPQAASYTNAETAARSALSIDPQDVGGNRAMGFVAFWWDHDIPRARTYFRRALRADRDNAQTQFWYGNALIENGETAAGLAALRQARLSDPDSGALAADYAWDRWQSGAKEDVVPELEVLERSAPTLASPSLYLMTIAFARGDWAAYLRHGEAYAARENDRELALNIAQQRRAFETRGPTGLLDAVSSVKPTLKSHVHDGTVLPAAAAASAGRRERLLDLLVRAEANGEKWSSRRWPSSIFARWRNEPDIGARLDRLLTRPAATEHLAG
jgi:tetratricopeptide (TPR) repeat protein